MECRFCGKSTTLLIDGQPICEECREIAGSCCLEFGDHDLWQNKKVASNVSTSDTSDREDRNEHPKTR